MKQKWNDRYSSEEYFFGKEPNDFFKEEIDKISHGKALFIGDGEGRNSIYAAKLGWQVDSIDVSEVGKSKAEKLAEENKVKINYIIADALEFNYPKEAYDLVAVIYFHADEELREQFHKHIYDALKPNGKLIYLVYDKDHLKLNTNGPSSLNLLYSLENIVEDFIDLDFELLKKEKISRVKNGIQQESIIIKFVGKKLGL
ncbi:MAG: class I SAM-dependent methyltransferase [Ignavibacteriales bacterium]|nr:class I SAM-dependent methyltransferase [Ignavibacteriota bacterium]MCB9248451.1 class I SAM-dependent methyltransferase [Ignavibacteriales bacterium]